MFPTFRRWLPNRIILTLFFTVFIFQIGFLVGCAKLLNLYDGSLWKQVQQQDSAEYYTLAQSLLADGRFYLDGFPVPETFRTIGYPAIVAGIFAVTGGSGYAPGRVPPTPGDSFYIVLGFIALVAAATSALVYGIATELRLPRGYAIAAGFLFGVSPAVLFLPVSGMGSDMVFAFLLALALYLVLHFPATRQPFILAASIGFVMGLGTLTRPVGQYFSLLLILAIPFMVAPRWFPSKHSLLISAVAFLTFLATVAPWLIRNYHVAGHAAISSIPPYSFAHYNIPQFLAHYKGTSEGAELKVIDDSLGNPPDKINRSFAFTDEYSEINKAFVREYYFPYAIFHAFKMLPFFLGSGIDVSYAVLAIETKWQLHVPFLPHVDENLSNLVYSGDYVGILKNLLKYWPATLERLVWAALFLGVLLAPFLARDTFRRKFFIFSILTIGLAAFLASPVAQPRYRVPVEPLIWTAGLFSLSIAWPWLKLHVQRLKSRFS